MEKVLVTLAILAIIGMRVFHVAYEKRRKKEREDKRQINEYSLISNA